MATPDDKETATIFMEMVKAWNLAIRNHSTGYLSPLIAANAMHASLLAWAAHSSDDPNAFIESMIDSLRERIDDIRSGRTPMYVSGEEARHGRS